ncbi:MAG: 6-phosphofructokinase [Opitutaceae bacterium]|nr:6-phosphofructokinase [Opitutaceae bacterium]
MATIKPIKSTKPIKRIGILTAGGDSPGLNAAIRAVGKTAVGQYGWELIGFRDGFLGMIEDRWVNLDKRGLVGMLTLGGTVLGTSRDKPHRMPVAGGGTRDMTAAIVKTYRRHKLDALVCIGGGGTHKNAARLIAQGLNIVSLPKTIDNDVALTDDTIGFDTALGIATEVLDRLHSTAHSHHRIIIAEIMGHRAGWLALGAGIAGGADVILIPEIPYDVEKVAAAIRLRSEHGSNFSIVAVAEGALPKADATELTQLLARRDKASTDVARKAAKQALSAWDKARAGHTMRLAKQLEELTHLEARVTILGYVQRGGTPSCHDRLLATRLGTAAVEFIREGKFGQMVASRGDNLVAVPIAKVAKSIKVVPANHWWVEAARRVATCMGD